MINGKKVLAIIPARGGSKGIPHKNIVDLAGKPLIAWTIIAAKQSKYIDKLIVSSDDIEIIDIARSYGCEAPFIRPYELSQDETSSVDVVIHALNNIPQFDYTVLLQPTSPLRNTSDIDSCLEKCLAKQATSCVGIVKVACSPFWMYRVTDREQLEPVIKDTDKYYQRQQLPPCYELNGAVYVIENKWFKTAKTFIADDTVGYIMPKERSVDIDTLDDLKNAECILS